MYVTRVVVGLAVVLPCTVFSQAVMKPKGESSQALIAKALTAKVEVDHGIAEGTMTVTYANPNYGRIEAEFVYAIPKGMHMTGFAYWYGDEKVVAKAVEKEEAKRIYQAITERQHDPALIEMIGKNTFRVRIFPVQAGHDLKVELSFVLTTVDGAFELPIQQPKGSSLGSLHVEVATDGGAWKDNYGLSWATANGKSGLVIDGAGMRPEKPLRFRPVPEATGLHAQLQAARSGGDHGFFALTLTADKAVSRPKVTIDGVKTYNVVPHRLPNLRPGQTVTIAGRYVGTGTATVALSGSGQTEKTNVEFTDAVAPNSAAARLWAVLAIESLGSSDPEMTKEIAFRFGLPSKYTSWLAVPELERARFAEQIKRGKFIAALDSLIATLHDRHRTDQKVNVAFEKVDLMAKKYFGEPGTDRWRHYWIERALEDVIERYGRTASQDGEHSAQTLVVRKLLDNVQEYAKNEFSDDDFRSIATDLGRWMASDAYWKMYDGRKGDSELRAAMAIDTAFGTKGAHDSLLESCLYDAADSGSSRSNQRLYNEFIKRGYFGKQEFTTLVKKQRASDEMETTMRTLVQKSEAGDLKESDRDYRRYKEIVTKWGPITALKEDDPLIYLYWNLESELGSLHQQLVSRIEDGKGHSPTAENLRSELNRIDNELMLEPGKLLRVYIDEEVKSLASRYDVLNYDALRDLTSMKDVHRRLFNLCAEVGYDPEKKLEENDHGSYMRDAGVRDKYVLALRAGNEDEIKKYADELRKTSARPEESTEARLEYLKIETELDRLQTQKMTPDLKAQWDALMAQRKQLFVKMGDPLVYVSAPKDAKRVVAELITGQLKELQWNEARQRWEARFEVPAWAKDGTYKIAITIVLKDGTVEHKTFTFVVDTTAPKASVANNLIDGMRVLEVNADTDAARAEVFTADGLVLPMDKVGDGRFSLSVAQSVDLSGATVVVTDRAHNRTEIHLKT